jgi:hypothetical protein
LNDLLAAKTTFEFVDKEAKGDHFFASLFFLSAVVPAASTNPRARMQAKVAHRSLGEGGQNRQWYGRTRAKTMAPLAPPGF